MDYIWSVPGGTGSRSGERPGDCQDDLVLIRDTTPDDDLSAFGDEFLWRRVAVEGADLLGVARRERSTWHPRWDWAYVEVLPPYRRRGIGRALVADLGAPCKARVEVGSEGAAFLRSLGWRLLQGCEIHVLPTTGGATPPKTLPVQAVSDAWWAFYVRAHRWDPVSEKKSAKELAETVADAEVALLVGTEEHPLAVGCIWPKPGAWEFSGGACRDGAGSTELFDLACAYANGLPLHVEVDSDMSEVHAELQRRGSTVVEAIEILGH